MHNLGRLNALSAVVLQQLAVYWPGIRFSMLLRTAFMLSTCLLSTAAFANRELILRPTSATYELVGGYTLHLVASPDGKNLQSVTLSYQNSSMTIPAKELSQVKNPVLSAVQVSAGALGSKNIAVPQAITIGFGAYNCELSVCPYSVIFVIEDLKLVESFVVQNEG